MRRIPRWPAAALLVLGLPLVAAGFWFRSGARYRAEYLARIDALREAGAPVEWDDIERQPVSPRENAYPLLRAAGALAVAIDDELSDVDPNDPDRATLTLFCGIDFLPTSEELAVADEAIRRFEPGYRMIAEALRKPRLCTPRGYRVEDSFEGLPELGAAARFLEHRAYREPGRAADCTESILRIVRLWSPRSAIQVKVREVYTEMALGIVRHGLENGTLDPAGIGPRFRELLSDGDALAGLEEVLAVERVFWLWLMEQWRRGRDPFEQVLIDLEMKRFLDATLAEVDLPPIRLPELPHPPRYATWWGRPEFDRDVLSGLEFVDRGVNQAGRELAMRAEIRSTAHGKLRVNGTALSAYLHALDHLRERRLARIALALHEHARAHDLPPESLEDLEAILGEPLPVDALTGKPFLYEVRERTAILSAPPLSALHPKLESRFDGLEPDKLRKAKREEFLEWEVRYE